MKKLHFEQHYSDRSGWLRAAVLGANDGIISIASLVVGVAAAGAGRTELLITAIAGLVAGAMSMAAGEYVSVSSQADTENADLEREKQELATQPEAEHEELTHIYVERGLELSLARQVVTQLMAHDALAAHRRDELGISETLRARPVQAAFASAITFAVGAMLPVLLVMAAPMAGMAITVSFSSLVFLILLGFVAAKTGGADPLTGAVRVTFWGALAMGLTAVVGVLFGVGG